MSETPPDRPAEPSFIERLTTGLTAGRLALGLAVVALGLSLWPYIQPAGTRSGFDAQVRASLLDNPEVIREAVERLQTREAAEVREAASVAIRQNLAALHDDPRDPAIGPEDAAITVVQFFDYRCPGCKAVSPEFRRIIDENPDVRFVFKEWPILDRDGPPVSEYAARAALAADAQGRYLAVHQALMAAAGLDQAAVDRILVANGINLDMARATIGASETDEHIVAVARLAQLIGAQGTPTFIVNGEMTQDINPDTVRAAIRRARGGDGAA